MKEPDLANLPPLPVLFLLVLETENMNEHLTSDSVPAGEDASAGFNGTTGHCEAGERCSCPPGNERRQEGRCAYWQPGEQKPIKVYGLLALEKSQKPLIEKHCFGDCGKVSMAGIIHDDLVGGLMVCCEEVCPWLGKQTDTPYGTTMSFGKPHEIFLRVLSDTPGSQQ